MRYIVFWGIQIILVFVLIGAAKARSRSCQWSADKTTRRLQWGIATVAFVQVADFISETMEDKGLGILYHIQWIGVYWIALAVFRRRILREAGKTSAPVTQSNA
jgi:hypothetical protein